MQSIQRKYSQNLYLPWLTQIIDHGDAVEARGRQFKEILDGISIVEEPQHHCILMPSRRWNPWLAMSEALWILAGRNDFAALKPYNSHIDDYSDDGITLYGAYGPRIYYQIDDLIERLRKDPSDRRAVLQIWDSMGTTIERPYYFERYDLTAESKDPPCNTQIFFKLRNNKLHMTVICRSNDLHFGLFAVNLPTFGILQEYIAARLGVDLGYQTHISNSLHVYTDDERAKDITRRMLYDEPERYIKYPEHERIFTDLTWVKSHKEFASMCSDVLEQNIAYNPSWPIFLTFANTFLRLYKNHKDKLDISSHMPNLGKEKWPDWVIAAQLFTGVMFI